MKKKLLSSIMILTMVATIFTGCGKSESSSDSKASNKTKVESTENSKSESKKDKTDKKEELEDKSGASESEADIEENSIDTKSAPYTKKRQVSMFEGLFYECLYNTEGTIISAKLCYPYSNKAVLFLEFDEYGNLTKTAPLTVNAHWLEYEYDKEGNKLCERKISYGKLQVENRAILDESGKIIEEHSYLCSDGTIDEGDKPTYIHRFEYDDNGRKNKSYMGNYFYTYEYDDKGILAKKYCYDYRDESLCEEYLYEYNNEGNLFKEAIEYSKQGYTTDLIYDEFGVQRWSYTVDSDNEIDGYDYEYNEDGKVSRMTYYNNNVIERSIEYEYSSDMIKIKKTDSVDGYSEGIYELDSDGNIKRYTYSNADTGKNYTREYVYDNMGNVIKIMEDNDCTYEFEYDSNGMRTKEITYIDYGSAGCLVNEYQYDSNGKLQSFLSYDKDGKLDETINY